MEATKCPLPILRDEARWPLLGMTVVCVGGFAIFPAGCYGKHHVCAAHHPH